MSISIGSAKMKTAQVGSREVTEARLGVKKIWEKIRSISFGIGLRGKYDTTIQEEDYVSGDKSLVAGYSANGVKFSAPVTATIPVRQTNDVYNIFKPGEVIPTGIFLRKQLDNEPVTFTEVV